MVYKKRTVIYIIVKNKIKKSYSSRGHVRLLYSHVLKDGRDNKEVRP